MVVTRPNEDIGQAPGLSKVAVFMPPLSAEHHELNS